MSEVVVYTQRPDGTALWLPEWLMEQLGVKHGERLSDRQFGDEEVQRLLAARIEKQGGAKAGSDL
jgi:hypothetical protein